MTAAERVDRIAALEAKYAQLDEALRTLAHFEGQTRRAVRAIVDEPAPPRSARERADKRWKMGAAG